MNVGLRRSTWHEFEISQVDLTGLGFIRRIRRPSKILTPYSDGAFTLELITSCEASGSFRKHIWLYPYIPSGRNADVSQNPNRPAS